MRVAVATVQVPFIRGGAELLAEGLVAALQAHGHEAERVAVPFKWYPADTLLDHMLATRLLDLTESNGTPIDRLIALKFPATAIAHPHKVLWLLHQHRAAYDMWDGPYGDLIHDPAGSAVREAIVADDARACDEARAVYTISRNVSARLAHFNGVASTPLYHPPAGAAAFHNAADDGYLLCPSRLAPLKRQGLLLEALARTRHPVRAVFVGRPDVASHQLALEQQAARLGLGDRARFLGGVSEAEKLALYARARAVAFVPHDEDYGYITLEAMLASKPVVTTTDAGGPTEFVVAQETGAIARPEADAIAEALDAMWERPALAAAWGRAGRARYEGLGISWEGVVSRLLA